MLPGLAAVSLHLGLALCIGLPDESKDAPSELEIELDFAMPVSEMPSPAVDTPKVSATSDTSSLSSPAKLSAPARELLASTAGADTHAIAEAAEKTLEAVEATPINAATDLDASLLDGVASGDSRLHHASVHATTITRSAPRFTVTRGPRLLSSSPSCSDLFARASLGAGTLALVDVDSHGAARLSRLLGEEEIEPALLDASRACVERLSFEPARDESGAAHEGTARLRLRPSSEG